MTLSSRPVKCHTFDMRLRSDTKTNMASPRLRLQKPKIPTILRCYGKFPDVHFCDTTEIFHHCVTLHPTVTDVQHIQFRRRNSTWTHLPRANTPLVHSFVTVCACIFDVMASLILLIHVVGAVFIFGPLAILPMTGLRALRGGEAGQIRGLAQSLNIFAWLSLIVALAGVAYVPLAPAQWHLSLTDGWLLWSIVLTIVAIVLSFIVVIPRMRSAADSIEIARESRAAGRPTTAPTNGTSAPGAVASTTAQISSTAAAALASAAPTNAKPAEYTAVASSSGIVSLLLLVVAILMVIH